MRKSWLMASLAALSLLALRPQKAPAQPQFLDEQLIAEVSCLNIPVATATLVVTEDSLATRDTSRSPGPICTGR